MDGHNAEFNVRPSSTHTEDAALSKCAAEAYDRNANLHAAQLGKATETFLDATSKTYGKEKVDACKISKNDWSAAFALYMLGPDLYKRVGHDTAQSWAKKATVFAVAPSLGTAAECQRSFANISKLGLEAASFAGVGLATGFLAKYFPGTAPFMAIAGLGSLANDQFSKPENQIRNKKLMEFASTIDRMDDNQLVDASRQVSAMLGPDIFHGSVALLSGAAGFKNGDILGGAAKAAVSPKLIGEAIGGQRSVVVTGLKQVVPTEAGPPEGIKIPLTQDKSAVVNAMDGDRLGSGRQWFECGSPIRDVISNEQLIRMPLKQQLDLIENHLNGGDVEFAYSLANQLMKWHGERFGIGSSLYSNFLAILTSCRNMGEEKFNGNLSEINENWLPKFKQAMSQARSYEQETPIWPLKQSPEEIVSPGRIAKLSMQQRLDEIEVLIKSNFLKDAQNLSVQNEILQCNLQIKPNDAPGHLFVELTSALYAVRAGLSGFSLKSTVPILEQLRAMQGRTE